MESKSRKRSLAPYVPDDMPNADVDRNLDPRLPGERRVAVSMGAAADAALARPMHKEQDDDQHKSKKAKPIQTLSQ